ncbi:MULTISPECIES: hypothetical protein [Mameliella]|uniref:hypothetical protein n=1 Tax=Mameliella TaxID=1434019 RepID=UPI0005BE5C0D|nr:MULTISPECIES: hypothetical protein [Mameliella]MDD9733706.1 hypothetical protein [Mameliella sp. AT18]ODM49483.1 hypothetical protein A9320_14565 [Ruegeria sp. PBVC088]
MLAVEKDIEWYEVWTDARPDMVYVLVLLLSTSEGFIVFDPKIEKIVAKFRTYDDALNFLCEDEFSKVVGREIVDK